MGEVMGKEMVLVRIPVDWLGGPVKGIRQDE